MNSKAYITNGTGKLFFPTKKLPNGIWELQYWFCIFGLPIWPLYKLVVLPEKSTRKLNFWLLTSFLETTVYKYTEVSKEKIERKEAWKFFIYNTIRNLFTCLAPVIFLILLINTLITTGIYPANETDKSYLGMVFTVALFWCIEYLLHTTDMFNQKRNELFYLQFGIPIILILAVVCTVIVFISGIFALYNFLIEKNLNINILELFFVFLCSSVFTFILGMKEYKRRQKIAIAWVK